MFFFLEVPSIIPIPPLVISAIVLSAVGIFVFVKFVLPAMGVRL
jgi:hypothetical protein